MKKKIVEGKVNSVGEDLGLGSNLTKDFKKAVGLGRSDGASSSGAMLGGNGGHGRDASRWDPFSSETEYPPDSNRNSAFPLEAEIAFGTKPRNYPRCLNFVYIDHQVLSDEAKVPVSRARLVYLLVFGGLLLNLFIAALLTILKSEKHWIHLAVSGALLVALTLFELTAYESAFRGAYQTSESVRMQYVVLGLLNTALLLLYTFAGVSCFNGWLRQRSASPNLEDLHRVLAGIEASYWTLLLFYATYSIFDYNNFRTSGAVGLSTAALQSASESLQNGRSMHSRPGRFGGRRGQVARADGMTNDKVQEIRDRYRNVDV